MSDLQFRFDNETAYGGTTNWTVPVEDMPDYPYTHGAIIEEIRQRADQGLLWTYPKYEKDLFLFNFIDISDAAIGTLRAIATAGKNFDFYDDVNGSGGTYTLHWIGGFEPQETLDGYHSLLVRAEEV